MVGAEVRRHRLGMGRLVIGGLGETDRERLNRPARPSDHHRHHRRRVDATREERAEWNIGLHTRPHRPTEDLCKFVHSLLAPGSILNHAVCDIHYRPVRLISDHAASGIETQEVSRSNLPDVPIDGAGSRDT